jgi:hypothetical protein
MTDHPESLTLYFVADNVGLDNNRDLFTWAPTADDAIADWHAFYGTDISPQSVFAIPTVNPQRGPVPWDSVRTEMPS